jgi:hypothetical protein
MRLPTLLDDFRQDVAFATRTVLRTPGFSVAALSLGLAVGATTAAYSTARWLLDRSPEGVLEPDRLVGLSLSEAGRPDLPHYGFSFPQYEALAELQDAFVGVAAYAKLLAYASTDVWAAEVVHQFVTGGYFSLLGVRPHLGRLIGPEDDFDGAPALAVISHAFWQSRFEADPNVIGAEMRFRVDRVRVIGVLPPEYSDYSLDWNGPTDVWLPMRSARVLNGMPGMLTMKSTFFGSWVASRRASRGIRRSRWRSDGSRRCQSSTCRCSSPTRSASSPISTCGSPVGTGRGPSWAR